MYWTVFIELMELRFRLRPELTITDCETSFWIESGSVSKTSLIQGAGIKYGHWLATFCNIVINVVGSSQIATWISTTVKLLVTKTRQLDLSNSFFQTKVSVFFQNLDFAYLKNIFSKLFRSDNICSFLMNLRSFKNIILFSKILSFASLSFFISFSK